MDKENLDIEFWNIMSEEYGNLNDYDFSEEEGSFEFVSEPSVFRVFPIQPGIVILINDERYYGKEAF